MQNGKEIPDWNETKAKLKQKISQIAGANSFLLKEQNEELLSRLEIKLGLSREIILKIISTM